MKKILAITFLSGILVFTSCSKDDDYEQNGTPPVNATVLTASGAATDLESTINQFRKLLGDSLNSAPGKTSGRREVNWDGVPPNFTNNNAFPADFFNLTDPAGGNGRKRGLVYTASSLPLRLDSSNFSELDPSYADEFQPFSKKKALISAQSNISEILFKVPGTATDAFIKGFGIVFSDIDDASSTTMEFFNGNKSLGIYKAPVQSASGGFSFLGVYFTDEKVTRVRITAGNGVLGNGVKDKSDGGTKDLVVYDDFFYNEPLSIN